MENPIYAYDYNKSRLLILKKHGSLSEHIFGLTFYALTRLIKLLLLLSKGKVGLIRAELRAVRDFLIGRYGDYDRKKLINHYD